MQGFWLKSYVDFVTKVRICVLILICTSFALAGVEPSGLRCELLREAGLAVSGDLELTTAGIRDSRPEFGWVVNSSEKNDVQTAYQIMAASERVLLEVGRGDIWDSGKVESDNSVNVTYGGKALGNNRSYFWKVRIWNKNGAVSGWSGVEEFVTGAVFSGYGESSIARYKQRVTEVRPVSVKKIGDGHYLADFGKASFGYLLWDTRGLGAYGGEKRIVEIYMGEKLKDGVVDRLPGGTVRYYYRTIEAGEGQVYEIHVGSGDKIPVEFGSVGTYRYVEVVNSPWVVTAESLRQMFLHNPFDDEAASFVCDNETLNDVWGLCYYSMKETSWCGIFVDGDRERTPYEADAYINQLGYYCSDSEYSIGRYSTEYLMTHGTWPTEWRQHMAMMVWADYMYTGNVESLAYNYEALKGKIRSGATCRWDGLIDPNTRDITDWPASERDGFDFKGVNGVVNAFYYHGLRLMERMAGVLERRSDAAMFGSEAEKVYESYQKVFYNGETGLYVDGEGALHSSIHVNMLAAAFGLVLEVRKGVVVDFIKTHRRSSGERIACSVYGAQYLLEALYLCGEENAALEIITNSSPTSWVNMIEEGSSVAMEAWGGRYKKNQDWNHAWGAVPANIIPRFVGGIRPIAAGFKNVLIHPQPGTLKSFAIKMPTIRGAIELSMRKEMGSNTFEFSIPVNMTVKFILPRNCDGFRNVTIDGKRVTVQRDGSVRYIEPIGSGDHTLVCN
jgi:hypothetical protein